MPHPQRWCGSDVVIHVEAMLFTCIVNSDAQNQQQNDDTHVVACLHLQAKQAAESAKKPSTMKVAVKEVWHVDATAIYNIMAQSEGRKAMRV